MKVLFTGATGFLGSRILKSLLDKSIKYEITILKRSFSKTGRIESLLGKVRSLNIDEVSLESIFHDAAYEMIVHCATNFGRKTETKSEMIESNLLLPLQLLELAIKKGGLKVFVNTDTILDKNISDYSLSKKHFHEWLLKFSDQVNSVNLCLEHFYGPGDDDSKFATFIIQELLKGSMSIPLTLGEQKRDFIYIDDVVNAFDAIFDRLDFDKVGYSEFQIGSGKSVRVRDFVTMAKDICGNGVTKLDFGALPYRPNEPMNVGIDVSELAELGWKSSWSLRQGLESTISYEREKLK